LDTTLNELRDIGEQHRGRVVMACVPSVARGLMPKCVEYCAEKWPEVSFAIEDVAAKDVVAKVQRGDIEFGLSGGEIDDSELHIESLMRDPFLLVCRRDDALAQRKTVSWTKLSERRLVMLNNTSGSRQQIVDTLASAGVRSEIFLELAQPSSVLAMVEASLGVAVVPELVAPYIGHPTLTTRKLVKPSVSRTIFLLRRRDRSLSPAASAVWSALRHLFGEPEATIPSSRRG
jgi:DNA-binding transcriptional LysR family regulator